MKAVVLAGDKNYTVQLSTTIKSILYHNKDVKIYILHQDIPLDWFDELKKLVSELSSEVVEVRIEDGLIRQEWQTQVHITPVAYARYNIPSYIAEDRVLYLDSDIIVNGDLDFFFNLDLQGYPLAAIRDADGNGFNSGVLVIDNQAWRRMDFSTRLLSKTDETMKLVHQGVFENFNGDQTIFNQVFQDNWLELDRMYNLQVGHDVVAFYSGWNAHFEMQGEPLIIHYTTYRKPWTTLIGYRYRDLWWSFHQMTFQDIKELNL